MQMIPFDKRDGHIWVDGFFKKWNESTVHILNHGLHYGSCVFEGIRIYNGKIFKLDEHIERLFRSAELLDLKIPYDIVEVKAVTSKITEKQKVKNGYIRPYDSENGYICFGCKYICAQPGHGCSSS